VVRGGARRTACVECAEACTAYADACLSEEMVAELTTCLRTNADCADAAQSCAGGARPPAGSSWAAWVEVVVVDSGAQRLAARRLSPQNAAMDSVPGVELADVARLAEGDSDTSAALRRIVDHATRLVAGCSGASLTLRTAAGEEIVATTGDRVERCHAVQFTDAGEGPAREAMRFAEPRRCDDLEDESRWSAFVRTARAEGFGSCLALPLPSDRSGTSALNLYADAPATFSGTTFDVALLFAAQGGVALDNVRLYRSSQEMVRQLHRTLTTRSLIERAKGLLMGEHGISSDQAFELLRERSQRSDRKLRDVALALLERHDPGSRHDQAPWTPPRSPSNGPPTEGV
jgi:GAF domain-containing protein